jgi:hypothetical protein
MLHQDIQWRKMRKTDTAIHLALIEALLPVGFSRKGNSWFRISPEVVEIVNLQRSQFSPRYYINYALWLRALGDEAPHRPEQYHVQLRIDGIVETNPALSMLMDLDSDVPPGQRTAELSALLRLNLLPFAETCRRLHGLRELYNGKRLKRAFIFVQAKQLLSS